MSEQSTLDAIETLQKHLQRYGPIINHNRKHYVLVKDAYLDSNCNTNEVYYGAPATCLEDSSFAKIFWNIRDEYFDDEGNLNHLPEDESDACDWDNPDYILTMGSKSLIMEKLSRQDGEQQ